MIAHLPRYVAYLTYALILVPTAIVVASSFTTSQFIVFPPVGLSGQWYTRALADRELMAGLRLSLLVALGAVAVSLALGTMAALYLSRPSVRGRSALAAFFLAPLTVPSVMTAFALLLAFSSWGLINQPGLTIAHVVLTVPYIIRTVLVSLAGADPSLPRAAAILGANPWRVFWHVTLPLIRPGMVAGAVFAFLVSFNNVTISVFIASPGTSTLPVVLFQRMERFSEPTVAAAASTIVVSTIVIMLLLDRKLSLFQSLFR